MGCQATGPGRRGGVAGNKGGHASEDCVIERIERKKLLKVQKKTGGGYFRLEWFGRGDGSRDDDVQL